ncbi:MULTISPECIES: hypothetical protein [Spirosoma]|uniref:Uncharacterized protein n=1 Tax=Spirosoma sordidisoli TaxID=2502893 RepID=A0A4Q2USI2_9BACT|nr:MULTISPECIES: hypothetical protein [Spirosoma]RYC69789.1 hypothetical protein EQG79_14435 [Spirosoma sordidisoli]
MAELTAEQKLEAALKDIEGLKTERTTYKTERDQARQDLAKVVVDLETAKKTLIQQTNQLAAKDSELQSAARIVTELKQTLASQQADSDALPTISHGKDSYELLTEFSWKGQVVTVATLRDDAKLVAELIREGVATLRKVVK